MSGGPQLRQSRSILYEDTVMRKTGKFLSDEPLTLTTARVCKTLSSGEDSVGVELTGCKRASTQFSDAKFQINLSGPHWDYHIDKGALKLTVSITDTSGRLKERHVLKMESQRQLAAWTAEFIQASTFEPEHTLQRCFHVALGCEVGVVSQNSMYVRHGVLQVRYFDGCKLMVCDPLSLSDIRSWELSQLESFVIEFFPHFCLRVKPLELMSDYGAGDSIFFFSMDVARQALAFIVSVFESRLPKLFQTAERLEYQGDTSQGAITRAVVYNMKQSGPEVAVKRPRPTGSASGRSLVSASRWLSYGTCTQPYAVTEFLPIVNPNGSQGNVSPLKLTNQQASQHALPPSNLTRPGVPVPRMGPGPYVQMSPSLPPTLTKLENVSIDSSEDYEEVPDEDDFNEVADDCDEVDNVYEEMSAGVMLPISTIGSELPPASPDD